MKNNTENSQASEPEDKRGYIYETIKVQSRVSVVDLANIAIFLSDIDGQNSPKITSISTLVRRCTNLLNEIILKENLSTDIPFLKPNEFDRAWDIMKSKSLVSKFDAFNKQHRKLAKNLSLPNTSNTYTSHVSQGPNSEYKKATKSVIDKITANMERTKQSRNE